MVIMAVDAPTEVQVRKHSPARRLWIVPVVTALALVGGFVYLQRATPIYTSSARLSFGNSADLAARANALRATSGWQAGVRTELAPGSSVIVVSYDSPDARRAAVVVNDVVDAYLKAAAAAPTTAQANETTTTLLRKRDDLARERERRRAELAAFTTSNPQFAGPDSMKTQDERLAELTRAFTASQIQASEARASLEATTPMLQDPRKAQDLINLNRSKGIFTYLDGETQQITAELAQADAALAQLKQTLGEQNPRRVAAQRTVSEIQQRMENQQKRYVEVYRTYLEQQWETAKRKQEDLASVIEQEKTKMAAMGTKAQQHGELLAAVKRADDALAAVEEKVKEAKLVSAAVGGDVRLEQAAQTPVKPTWPDKTKVMAMALGAGIGVGLIVSIVAMIVGRS